MARIFINMFQDNTLYGYWIVEFIDENGQTIKKEFETDLDAREFYNELILEKNPS